MKKNYCSSTILGVETSCDDTSIAILSHGKIIRNEVITNNKLHVRYGGIVPEIAARNHASAIIKCFFSVIDGTTTKLSNIDYVAYTYKPGLAGSLHVGKIFSKTLSFLIGKPIIKIDHMLAHAFSFSINKGFGIIKFPFICLNASGGNTMIYLFNSFSEYTILNSTSDDAVGECLDKIGRILNLPYPGGLSIDKIYDERKANLKLINHYSPAFKFSFSGLKTFVFNYVNSLRMKNKKIDSVIIGSSVLRWCIDELIKKIIYYSKIYKVKTIVIGGGVSSCKLLRTKIKEIKCNITLAEKQYCNDNAAMVANLAYLFINNGISV